ncbi:5893_t:CDS:1, partial [Acaulospora morrowiae]
MNATQREETKILLRQESDVFAGSIQELGRTDEVHHEIDTDDARPIKQNAYRMAPSIREFVKQEISQLKDRGLI